MRGTMSVGTKWVGSNRGKSHGSRDALYSMYGMPYPDDDDDDDDDMDESLRPDWEILTRILPYLRHAVL